jgi:hypothetical protein
MNLPSQGDSSSRRPCEQDSYIPIWDNNTLFCCLSVALYQYEYQFTRVWKEIAEAL